MNAPSQPLPLPRRLAPAVDNVLLATAMVWPTVGTWLYFERLAGTPLAEPAYLLTKLIQFSLPLPYLTLLWRALRGASGDRRRGVAIGAALLCSMLLLYAAAAASTGLVPGVRGPVRAKVAEFGLGHPAVYLGFALTLSVVHSLLEELYWRGYVYGALRRSFAPGPSTLLSSLAFTAHHVVVVRVYVAPLAGAAATGTLVLAALAIVLAGGLWCRLYERSRSLVAPWLSHAAADAAIMAAGAHLVWG